MGVYHRFSGGLLGRVGDLRPAGLVRCAFMAEMEAYVVRPQGITRRGYCPIPCCGREWCDGRHECV
jgi:hypothetical protein